MQTTPSQARNTLSWVMTILLIAMASPARADDTQREFRLAHHDFFRLLTGEGKDIEARYVLEPKSESSSGNGRFELSEGYFSAELPVPVTRDFFLRLAPEYDLRVYKFHAVHLLGEQPRNATLHKIGAGVGFGSFFSDQWLATGKFVPTILSDLEDRLDHDQLRYYGEFVIVYQYNPNLQVVGGAVSDGLFRGTDVYPVLALRMTSEDKKWHLKLTPPVDARLGYQVSPSDQVYLRFSQTGDTYRVDFPQADLKFDLRIEDRRLGVGLLHWFDPHFNFSCEAGFAILSRFKFKVNLPDLPDEDSDPTPYASISMGYAL